MDAGEATVILARARQGDEDAFRVLVELHARAAFRLAFRLMRDERDAEDVVQDSSSGRTAAFPHSRPVPISARGCTALS